MTQPFRFSLIFTIITSLACLLGLTWILISFIFFNVAAKDLFTQKSEEGRVLLAAFIHLVPADPAAISASPAVRFAEGLAKERDFDGLALFDRAGRLLYRTGDSGTIDAGINQMLKGEGETGIIAADGARVVRYAPLLEGDAVVGASRLSLSLTAEHGRLNRSRHLFFTYFLLDSLLLICIGSFLLFRAVVVPVTRLLAATERIVAGDYAHPVNVPGSAEIARLAEAYNRMQLALRSKDAAVASHVASLERANRELREAREESVRSEKMASVGLLAAGMAHEIGTPLAAVMGYAGILRDELGQDPEKEDYLRRIEEDCARIDGIVRDLLDYARPAPTAREPVDIARLLQDTLHLLEGQGVLKRIEIFLDLAEALPPVHADPRQLQQVFINLAVNARDAMPGGGSLRLSARGEAGLNDPARPWVRVEIEDSGEGISPECREKIFEPFFTTKQPGKGTGLGLAIVARIVAETGGTIGCTSETGRGSRFTILLPGAAESSGTGGEKGRSGASGRFPNEKGG